MGGNGVTGKLTALKVFFHGHFSILGSVKRVSLCIVTCKPLDRLPVAKMGSLDPDALAEDLHPRTKRRVPEIRHRARQITRDVKGRRANIDIDHQLLMCWPDRRVEPLPRFKPATQPKWLGCGTEKVPISSYHDSCSPRGSSKDEVQCRNNGQYVVIPELRVTI